jgi:hypothetical protein
MLTPLLLTLLAAPAARADARYDLSLHVGAALGSVHESASAFGANSPIGPTGTPTPTATGDDTVFNHRLTVGGAIEVQPWDFGPGIPRFLVSAGATAFFFNSIDGTFTNLHPATGTANDTSVKVSRPFTIDLGIGGAFPFCQKGCAELHALVGASFGLRTVDVSTVEPNTGGAPQGTTDHALEVLPFLSVAVDVPLCKTCNAKLRFGWTARSQTLVKPQFTTELGVLYVVGVDVYVESELHVGLVLPL